MELGEKLRLARLEAGLSQRQLCGEEITRNMLSQIENGSARPSMKTLQYLAARLGKTVSYFLEETAVVSPNQQVMAEARGRFDAGHPAGALEELEAYRGPDPVYDREQALLRILCQLDLAEQALEEGRSVYARQLLEQLEVSSVYCADSLQRRRLLLLGQAGMGPVSPQLPSLDGELLLRAGEALAEKEALQAERLLEAMEDHSAPRWQLLRGECALLQKDFSAAAPYFHRAEGQFPEETAPKLEACYRELQDFRRAYEYACKQK